MRSNVPHPKMLRFASLADISAHLVSFEFSVNSTIKAGLNSTIKIPITWARTEKRPVSWNSRSLTTLLN